MKSENNKQKNNYEFCTYSCFFNVTNYIVNKVYKRYTIMGQFLKKSVFLDDIIVL
mgnify:FL=1